MPLQLGSPAIDAAGTIDPGGLDQRAFPRFVPGRLDLGVVEYESTAGRVTRTHHRDQAELGREVYSLGKNITLRWRTIESTTPLPHLLGRHTFFREEEEDDVRPPSL